MRDSGPILLGIRSESFEDDAFADPALPRLDVAVEVLEELGSDTHVIFATDASRVDADEIRQATEDDEVLLESGGAVFNARVDARTRARAGGMLRLAVDPGGFYFFDPETGLNVTAPDETAEPAESATAAAIAAE
jgi:ABC-type sugar transport system ATPase subunit